MTATRPLTATAELAACAALAVATVLIPLNGDAQAGDSKVALIPAPDGFVSVATLDIDDLVAQRKAAWAADRVERHLF